MNPEKVPLQKTPEYSGLSESTELFLKRQAAEIQKQKEALQGLDATEKNAGIKAAVEEQHKSADSYHTKVTNLANRLYEELIAAHVGQIDADKQHELREKAESDAAHQLESERPSGAD